MSSILKQTLAQAKNKQQEQVEITTQNVLNALKQQESDLITYATEKQHSIKTAIEDLYNPAPLTKPIQALDKELQYQLSNLEKSIHQALQSLSEISGQWIKNQINPEMTKQLLEQQISELMQVLQNNIAQTLDNHNKQTHSQIQQAIKAKSKEFQALIDQDMSNYHNLFQATQNVADTTQHLIHQINQAQAQIQHSQKLLSKHSKAVSWVMKYPAAVAISLMVMTLSTLALLIALMTQPDIYIDPKNKDHAQLQQLVHTTHTISSEMNKTKITTHQLIFPRRETTPYYTREVKFTPENPSNLELQGNPTLEVVITQTPEQQTAYRLANTPKEQ